MSHIRDCVARFSALPLLAMHVMACCGCDVDSRDAPSRRQEVNTGLGFTISISPKMKQTTAMQGMVAFSKDGTPPSILSGDPLFVAAPSKSASATSDQKQFALARLRNISNVTVKVIRSTEAVTIDNLHGFESYADAVMTQTGTEIDVYQVMLFDGSKYFLFQGIVGNASADGYLSEFKEIAHSFVRP